MVMYSMAEEDTAVANGGSVPTKSDLAPVTHVRKLFPETWLWKTLDTPYGSYHCTHLSLLCFVLVKRIDVQCQWLEVAGL